MSNGRNAERLDWQSCHTAKWWLAVCRPCSIAATCCRFRSWAFRPVGVKAVPDRMRECLHRCVRWEDEEVAAAACSYRGRCHSLSKLREKGGGRGRGGERRERGEEGEERATWRFVPHSRTPQNIYARRAAVTVSLTFGNSNYGNTPVAAAFTKLRDWPSVCVVLPDNLFLTDIKWPRSKCYAKPHRAVVVC